MLNYLYQGKNVTQGVSCMQGNSNNNLGRIVIQGNRSQSWIVKTKLNLLHLCQIKIDTKSQFHGIQFPQKKQIRYTGSGLKLNLKKLIVSCMQGNSNNKLGSIVIQGNRSQIWIVKTKLNLIHLYQMQLDSKPQFQGIQIPQKIK